MLNTEGGVASSKDPIIIKYMGSPQNLSVSLAKMRRTYVTLHGWCVLCIVSESTK